ncbi:MAG: MFS transporter [Candidatus Aminicenantes bacterium]|nr:MFS transporter [Candidatus Aminicenantes bacterium]
MTIPRRLLISASLFHGLNDAATVAIPMVFPILYAEQILIVRYSQIGLLSNFGLLTTLLFQILIVHASRRWDYRIVHAWSFVGISLSLLLIPLSSSYWMLFSLWLLFRVFVSFYHTLGMAWVARTHPEQGIDFAMGVQSGSGNLGVVLAFISAGFLAQRFGWPTSLRTWAAVCFVLGLISFLLVRNMAFEKDINHRLNMASWLQTIRRMRPVIIGFLFGGACWGMTVYFAPSLLHHKFGIPIGRTGFYLALWIGIGTVMTYLFGSLSLRFGRLRLYKLSFGGAVLSLFLIGCADRAGLAVAGLCVFGVFLFLIYPALQSFVGNSVPAVHQSQAFSFAANLSMVSGALISLFAGFISDQLGISSPFLVLGGLGAAAFVLSVFVFFPLRNAPSAEGIKS